MLFGHLILLMVSPFPSIKCYSGLIVHLMGNNMINLIFFYKGHEDAVAVTDGSFTWEEIERPTLSK